jgi:WD40 repeat protein
MTISHPGNGFRVFSPDQKTLAVGGYDKKVVVIDVPTGKELRTLEDHESSVFWGAFSTDGRTLFTATAEWIVHL